MNKYLYNGPVMEFGECVNEKWQGETIAQSEAKAKSNLAYQYKRSRGKTKDAKITLPGKLQIID